MNEALLPEDGHRLGVVNDAGVAAAGFRYSESLKWAVIPVRADKRPAVAWAAFQDRRPTMEELLGWFGNGAEPAGVAVVTGAISGVVVVDIDGEEGERTIAGLKVPRTVTALTGRGRHLYFAHPGQPVGSGVRILPGVDLRGDGGYVVAPPSRHPSGKTYQWAPSCSPFDVALAPLPGWASVRKQERVSTGEEAEIPSGRRNDVLASMAGAMRRRGMSAPALLAALLEENRSRCVPPLEEGEVRRIAQSVARYHPAATVEAATGAVDHPEGPDQDVPALPGAPATGWEPVDLAALAGRIGEPEKPAILTRDDGARLLYAGRIHWLSGEPESCKSWTAQRAGAEVIRAGGTVVYVDHEATPLEVLGRFESNVVPIDDIVRRLVYVRPDLPATPPRLAPLLATRPVLAVVDAAQGSIALRGGDPDRAADVAAWALATLVPFARAGAAVLVLDHVTKARETRGRWPVGSGHKLALADVAFRLESVLPFGRGRNGLSRLYIVKDRPGALRQLADGDHLADLAMESHPDGSILFELRPPEHPGAGGIALTLPQNRVMAACRGSGPMSSAAQIQEATAHDGSDAPLRTRTVQRALIELERFALVEGTEAPAGMPRYWTAK